MQSVSHAIAIIDIKTTGPRVLHDRLIEIGLILLDAQGSREWTSLLNPGVSIPPFMTHHSGIDNNTVANAPGFAEVAALLAERLQGRLLVAHHARLVYGFLKAEFERAGQRFQTRNLCALRLSRALNPEQISHSLSAMATHYGIDFAPERRAMGDARVLHHFLMRAEQDHGIESLREIMSRLNKRPTLPAYLDESLADELPECPGVYFFHGESSMLYIGKAKNIRSRVLSHFAADLTDSKEMRLSQQVRRISWETTAGELGALLREARYVKQWQPLHNRQLRRQKYLVSIDLIEKDKGLMVPIAVSGQQLLHGRPLYGLFNSTAAVTTLLRGLVSTHGFCDYALGLQRHAARPCSSRQLKRCRGLCDGSESIVSHNQRLAQVMAAHALMAWPFKGRIALEEYHPISATREFYVIDNWCWLGSANSLAEARQLASNPADLVLDKDSYRLLLTAILGKSALPVHPLTEYV